MHPFEIRYDIVKEFSVNCKGECDQLNLAHVIKNNIKRRN